MQRKRNLDNKMFPEELTISYFKFNFDREANEMHELVINKNLWFYPVAIFPLI
jgi:hypothetical protein